jgi:hypothetical protein
MLSGSKFGNNYGGIPIIGFMEELQTGCLIHWKYDCTTSGLRIVTFKERGHRQNNLGTVVHPGFGVRIMLKELS